MLLTPGAPTTDEQRKTLTDNLFNRLCKSTAPISADHGLHDHARKDNPYDQNLDEDDENKIVASSGSASKHYCIDSTAVLYMYLSSNKYFSSSFISCSLKLRKFFTVTQNDVALAFSIPDV